MIGLHPAPPELVPAMIAAMTPTDRTELATLASPGGPEAALLKAVGNSRYSFCYTEAGEPVAMGGLVSDHLWMVAATERLYHLRKSFLKNSRVELAVMTGMVEGGAVITIVDKRWRKSLKWLHWLGLRDVQEIEVFSRQAQVLEYRA